MRKGVIEMSMSSLDTTKTELSTSIYTPYVHSCEMHFGSPTARLVFSWTLRKLSWSFQPFVRRSNESANAKRNDPVVLFAVRR